MAANVSEVSEVAQLAELMLRKQCEDDLYTFVREAWPVIEGGNRFTEGWCIRIICEHIEELIFGRIRRLSINLPPRFGKSSIGTVCAPVWAWLHNPGEQIFSMSYSEKLAMRDNVKSRRLIKSEWFQKRWGNRLQLSDDQDAKIRVDNMQGGYRVIAGIGGTVQGEGGSLLILDDGNSPNDGSEAALENSLDFYCNVLPTRFNNFKTSRLLNVQQRVAEMDISGYIEANQKKDFVRLILPLEFEAKRCCVTIPLKSTNGKRWVDPRTEEGELLWPERIGPREVKELKNALASEYRIAGQLQQRPAPSEGGKIKRSWFKPWKDDKPPKCSMILQSWDTATSQKKSAAYSACTTWGIFKDDVGTPAMILLGLWRAKLEFPELYKQVQRMARDYTATKEESVIRKNNKPDIVLIEAKSSGHQILQTLNRTGLVLTPWNPDKYGDKNERVMKITHIIEGGRIFLPMRGPDFTKPLSYADILLSQCALFPAGDSRDIVDTMSSAIQRVLNSGWILHPAEVEAEREDSYKREHEFTEQQGFY